MSEPAERAQKRDLGLRDSFLADGLRMRNRNLRSLCVLFGWPFPLVRGERNFIVPYFVVGVKGEIAFFSLFSAFRAVLVHPRNAEALDAHRRELYVDDAGRAFPVCADDHAFAEDRMNDGFADLVGAVADGG